MPKKTSLSDVLAQAAQGPQRAKRSARSASPPAENEVHGARAPSTKPYRVGRVNVTGYFDPAVKKSLRLIQAMHPDRTVQDLLAEALNDLFAKYNVPQSANL